MSNPSGLVALEGKWSKSSNVSVKSLFDVLVDINFGNPHAYYFEHFANGGALSAIVENNIRGAKYLYIGAHGDENGICGSSDFISRTTLRNIFTRLSSSIRGIFLGSCLFGSENNADFLFDALPSSVKWIAGYNMSVDWIESSVLDLLFWNTLFAWDRPTKTFVFSAKETVESTCEEIQEYAPGLVGMWEFQVFMRSAGRGTGLRRLLQHNYYKS